MSNMSDEDEGDVDMEVRHTAFFFSQFILSKETKSLTFHKIYISNRI